MGTHKKEKNRKERQGATGDGMGNVKVKGENFYRYVVVRTLISWTCRVLIATQHREEGQGSQAPD